MDKLRIAVVGAGRLGGFHAQKLAAFDDVELAAVVDPLVESRERLAAQCQTAALPDHRSLLTEVDAAVIASPTRFHHKLAMDFLRRGVHVLVEKPICSTVAEADELLATAERHRAILQVGHVERFNPVFTAAAAELAGPRCIEAVRAGGFTFRSTDVGVVLDLMIHDIDLALTLAGSPVRSVEAVGFSVLGGHEDVANARLEFECGCVAALSASRVSCEPARRMQVWSAKAFATMDFAARTATLVRPSETLLSGRFDVEALTPAQRDYYREHLAEEHLPQERLELAAVDALALELRDFIVSVQTRQAPRVTGEHGRDALAVAQQVLARIHGSAAEGGREHRRAA